MPLRLLPMTLGHLPRFIDVVLSALVDDGAPPHEAMYGYGDRAAIAKSYVETYTAGWALRGVVHNGVFDVPQERLDDGTDWSYEGVKARQEGSEGPEVFPPPEWLIAGGRIRLEDEVTFYEPKAVPPRAPPATCNVEAYNHVRSVQDSIMHELMGPSTYWQLETLGTLAQHRGRGAARLVCDDMARRADAHVPEPVPCALQSTEMAMPVYQRGGYEVRRTIEVDMRPWLRPERAAQVGPSKGYFMVRPARRAGVGGGANGKVAA